MRLQHRAELLWRELAVLVGVGRIEGLFGVHLLGGPAVAHGVSGESREALARSTINRCEMKLARAPCWWLIGF